MGHCGVGNLDNSPLLSAISALHWTILNLISFRPELIRGSLDLETLMRAVSFPTRSNIVAVRRVKCLWHAKLQRVQCHLR